MPAAAHPFSAFTFFAAMAFMTSVHGQSDCRPAPPGVAQLVEIRPGFHRVQGPLAEFDPCHRSVQLSMPGLFADKLADKPPLMVIAHGGNGPGSAEQEMVRRMNARGVATLLFDAYEMNGFQYRGTSLFLTGTTNESRQRMIFKATLGAYHWIRQNARIDTTRLYIHGLSNGGSVALNMAAVVDPAHVRMVFSEGAPSAGIGMPDQLRVPLKMVFGKIDNYGGRSAERLDAPAHRPLCGEPTRRRRCAWHGPTLQSSDQSSGAGLIAFSMGRATQGRGPAARILVLRRSRTRFVGGGYRSRHAHLWFWPHGLPTLWLDWREFQRGQPFCR
jgi:dienelactone hydrolase